MAYTKYPHFGRHENLLNGGRELLGRDIYWTEKRDGSNCVIYRDGNGDVRVGSRNMRCAEWEEAIKKMPEFKKISEWFEDRYKPHPDWVIYCEYIHKGKGPTKIERPKKYEQLVVIDIRDGDVFLPYNFVYQLCYHDRVPIVKLLEVGYYEDMNQLWLAIQEHKKWCKRHRREGVVGKVYGKEETIMFKEKIDLPKQKRNPNKRVVRPKYPPMPEPDIVKCLDRAKRECEDNDEDFRNPKFGMSRFVNHLNTEAREHKWNTPKGPFDKYSQYLKEMNA